MTNTNTTAHKGWTISKDRESGLQFIYRPDGTKYGQTQTEAAAKIMRRNGIRQEDATWSPEQGRFI